MVKKGRLSKLEIHFIKTNPNMSNEELAKELDRSVESVSKVIREVPEPQEEDQPEAVDGSQTRNRNLGKNVGWVSFTPADSVQGDDIPQKFTAKKNTVGVRKAIKET